MPRTPTPEGKRVGWSVKLSQPKSDAADAVRGTMLRARWLESLIDAAIAAASPAARRGHHEAPCTARVPSGAFCKTCGQVHK